LIHDDIDNVTFCGYCGLIPEPSPDWALTELDVKHIYHESDEEHAKPYFEPTVNKRGYTKYCEHVDELYERLGIK
jgi:hypothetical protein